MKTNGRSSMNFSSNQFLTMEGSGVLGLEHVTPPIFTPKKVCPKQLVTRCAAKQVSLDLYRLIINRLDELFVRLSREGGSPQDVFNTSRLAFKTYHGVRRFCKQVAWAVPNCPTLVEVHFVRRWAENYAVTLDSRIRLKRIQNWKKILHPANDGRLYFSTSSPKSPR